MTKVLTAVLVAVLVAGCAGRQRPAPVDDRRAAKPSAPQSQSQSKPQPAPAELFYTVKRGDTLYSIALEHGADYREVAQWNFLDDPTRLSVGQVLRVREPPQQPQPGVQVGPGPAAGRVESRPLGSAPEHKPAPKR